MEPPKDSALLERWTRLLNALGCSADTVAPAFADLRAHYTAAERHYHTLEHIQSVLDTIQTLAGPKATPALFLAAWFHDVIYDSRAQDNEEQSAAHARRMLSSLGASESILTETERLILLTKTHITERGDQAGEILIDADLAILGASLSEYNTYASAIRREYIWVPESTYRVGRRVVLQRFLERPRIYATEEMFTRMEGAARANIRREIAALS